MRMPVVSDGGGGAENVLKLAHGFLEFGLRPYTPGRIRATPRAILDRDGPGRAPFN